MDINRTGPRNTPLDNSTAKTEPNSSTFRNAAPAASSDSGGPVAGIPAGITRADLADTGRREEILRSCFGEMVDAAGRELGASISTGQKGDLLDFLGNDPLMRNKVLNYLEQSIK